MLTFGFSAFRVAMRRFVLPIQAQTCDRSDMTCDAATPTMDVS